MPGHASGRERRTHDGGGCERVATYKYPREVRFVAELPKGPTGKVLKNVLRAG